MTYRRVLPRDLFNEANLLKCWGQLWLLLDGMNSAAEIVPDETDDPFVVEQNYADGSISLGNVALKIGGQLVPVYRPLNSRDPWPLRCVVPIGADDEEEIEVFSEHGTLSEAFLGFIRPMEAYLADR